VVYLVKDYNTARLPLYLVLLMLRRESYLLVITSLLILLVFPVYVTLASNNTTTTLGGSNETVTTSGLYDLVSTAVSNPKVAITILIEIALGFALGYTAIKALKYILAFIGILFLGSALSVWSLGSNPQDLLGKLGEQTKELLPIIKNLLATFSIIVVGPVSIGFILGITAAILNK
jgi:uncharacterized membrane protein (Fun14 family)